MSCFRYLRAKITPFPQAFTDIGAAKIDHVVELTRMFHFRPTKRALDVMCRCGTPNELLRIAKVRVELTDSRIWILMGVSYG